MLRKHCLLLLFLCPLLGGMNMNHDPRVMLDGAHRKGFPEFFTSLRSAAFKYREILLMGDTPLPDRVPLIGHYQNIDTKRSGKTRGEFYNLRARIALIEHDAAALSRVIPFSVRAALTNAGIRDLSAVEFYTNIVGDFVWPDQEPIGGDTYSVNVAFHPALIRWRNTGTAHFNTADRHDPKVLAGIFEANNISPKAGGISFNALAPLDVYYHGAFSPDNGRLSYNPTKGLATFWLVGVYDGHAIVVFNIMALNPSVERLLLPVTAQRDFDGVLRVLRDVPARLADDDAVYLISALDIVAPSRSGLVMIPTPRTVRPAPVAPKVEPGIVDDMVQAFMDHLRQKNLSEALSLLREIWIIDPEKAVACQIAFEKQLHRE